MKSSLLFLTSLFIATVLAVSAASAQGSAMQLNTNEIHQDETAELTIQTSGVSSSPISPPVVPGLEFSAVNQSTQIQDINGSMSVTATVTYEITPQGPGLYTIPTHDPSAKNLTLRVLPGNAPANSASSNGAPSSNSLPPPSITWGGNPQPQAQPQPAHHSAPFLKAILPKNQLYVGEKVPIEIELGVPEDSQASMQDLPTLTADAFVMDKLPNKLEKSEQEIDGQPYIVGTWKSTLAAIKPGDFPLSMTIPITLRMPVQMPKMDDDDDDANSPFGGDPFRSSFFRNAFQQYTTKDVNLTSKPETISVLQLPTAGQPANFSGAVGKFTMDASVDPQSGAVGDPLTLHVSIKGTGSFDRVSTSLLHSVNGWKTYPPTSKFVPADSAGYSGEKDYDQAVIPTNAGDQTLPSPEFTFFNPDSRQYETIRASIPTVHIQPSAVTPIQGPVVMPPTQPATTSLAAGSTPSTPSISDDGLRPDEAEPLASLATLEPLYFQPLFLCGEALLAIAFIGAGFVMHRSRSIAGDRARRPELQHVEAFLTQMDEAAKARDAGAFFGSARAAFQHCFAWRWKMNPAAITVAEIDAHLNGKGQEIRRVFNLADELAYSHNPSGDTDFAGWRQTVRNLIKQAETL